MNRRLLHPARLAGPLGVGLRQGLQQETRPGRAGSQKVVNLTQADPERLVDLPADGGQ